MTFCSALLDTKSECPSSAITIDIHHLDPGVDRSSDLEKCLSGDCAWLTSVQERLKPVRMSAGAKKWAGNHISVVERNVFKDNYLDD
jgi:hypothetical protein